MQKQTRKNSKKQQEKVSLWEKLQLAQFIRDVLAIIVGVAVTITAQFINESNQSKSKIRTSLGYVKIELEDNLKIIDAMLDVINKTRRPTCFSANTHTN